MSGPIKWKKLPPNSVLADVIAPGVKRKSATLGDAIEGYIASIKAIEPKEKVYTARYRAKFALKSIPPSRPINSITLKDVLKATDILSKSNANNVRSFLVRVIKSVNGIAIETKAPQPKIVHSMPSLNSSPTVSIKIKTASVETLSEYFATGNYGAYAEQRNELRRSVKAAEAEQFRILEAPEELLNDKKARGNFATAMRKGVADLGWDVKWSGYEKVFVVARNEDMQKAIKLAKGGK